jgi:hypothetical protein
VSVKPLLFKVFVVAFNNGVVGWSCDCDSFATYVCLARTPFWWYGSSERLIAERRKLAALVRKLLGILTCSLIVESHWRFVLERDEAENKEPEFGEHPEVLCGGS